LSFKKYFEFTELKYNPTLLIKHMYVQIEKKSFIVIQVNVNIIFY